MKTLSLVGAALLAAGICSAAEPFKILSYNVRHCADMNYVLSPQATAKTIASEKARLVGLQEMDLKTTRVKGLDEPAELARLTGLKAAFGKAIPLPGGAYGNAILSQDEPIAVRTYPLPGREPRVLLLAEFKDCYFGSMHLDLVEANRLASVPIIREAVKAAAQKKPVFLCGDWNAGPNSPTLKALGSFMNVISTTKTNTFHGGSGPVAARVAKGCVIDFIAVDKGHAEAVEVLETHVTEDRQTSDHAPVSVTLKLK